MFDTPIDAWYAWIGLAIVSVALLAVVLTLARPPPPSPARLANAVDGVASSPYEARRRIDIAVESISVRTHAIGVRTPGGTAVATLAYGPVVPVEAGPLRAVLTGRPPEAVFESPGAFADALAAARDRVGGWRTAPPTLRVARVTWGDDSATLVG